MVEIMGIKITIYWDVTSCIQVTTNRRCGGTCLYIDGKFVFSIQKMELAYIPCSMVLHHRRQ